jgi:Conjugal transfer protein TraD
MSQFLRKADTRRKIELGGLIIKAGAADLDAMVLLGLLAEAHARVVAPGEYDRLQSLGRLLARKTEQ